MDDLTLLRDLRADAPEPGPGRLRGVRATVMAGLTAPPLEPLTAGAEGSGRGTQARRLPRRRLRRVGAALAAVGVGAVTLYGVTAAPAFAVDKGADGAVDVWIKEFRDSADLESALADAGVPAEVDYLPEGQTCAEPRGRPGAAGGMMRTSVGGDRGGTSFTIEKGQVEAGRTLVLAVSVADPARPPVALTLTVVEGPVSPCRPVPLPKPSGPAPTGDEQGRHVETREEDGPGLSSSGGDD
jgi:hypothetical protein